MLAFSSLRTYAQSRHKHQRPPRAGLVDYLLPGPPHTSFLSCHRLFFMHIFYLSFPLFLCWSKMARRIPPPFSYTLFMTIIYFDSWLSCHLFCREEHMYSWRKYHCIRYILTIIFATFISAYFLVLTMPKYQKMSETLSGRIHVVPPVTFFFMASGSDFIATLIASWRQELPFEIFHFSTCL